MKRDQRSRHSARATLLQWLSGEEAATVSMAETSERLLDGDEYVDLEQLAQGVQRWRAGDEPLRRLLPRKAIHERTWRRVIGALAALESAVSS